MFTKFIISLICALIGIITFFYMIIKDKQGKESQISETNSKAVLNVFPFCMGIIIFIAIFFGSGYINDKIDLLKVFIVILGCGIAMVWDVVKKIIPNRLIISMIVIRIIILCFEIVFRNDIIRQIVIKSAIGMVVTFLILMIFSLISKGGLGMGDVKLISVIGFYCGIYLVINSLMISLLLCTVISVISIIMKKRKLKDKIAFGPYIFIGVILSILLGVF